MTFLSAALAAMTLSVSVIETPEFSPGPPVGTKIPHDLGLADQSGAVRDLTDLSGENGLILLFNRSLDWCPFCVRQAIGINMDREAFESRGYKLAVLTYDPVDTLAYFAERRGIEYALLSDPDSEAIDAFGLRNKAYAEIPRKNGVPHPVIMAISPDGVIKAKLYEESYRMRPPVEAILESLDSMK